MLQPLSQAEIALRDTLITKATGNQFDRLMSMFGFERPFSISREVWRHALRLVAYGYRGTLGCTWGAFELGLRQQPNLRTVVGKLDVAQPHTFIGATFPQNLDGFTCEWIGRFVRIRYSLMDEFDELQYYSKVLYTIAPHQIHDNGPYPQNIMFCDVDTGLWDVEAVDNPLWLLLDGDGNQVNGDVEVTLELLPFMYREPLNGPLIDEPTNGLPIHPDTQQPIPLTFLRGYGDRCTVELYIDATEFFVPATYLLDPPAVDRTNFPGQPFGGHIMDQFGAVNGDMTPQPPGGTGAEVLEAGDPLGDGPHPIYLIDEAALAGFSQYFDPILAAGVQMESFTNNFCLFENTGVAPLDFGFILFIDNFVPVEEGGSGWDNGEFGGNSESRWRYNYIPDNPLDTKKTALLEKTSDGINVLVLRHGTPGNPAPDEGMRWAEINQDFTTPIRVSYGFIHGPYDDVPDGVDLNSPEANEDEFLLLEYSADEGTTWNNVYTHVPDGQPGSWKNLTAVVDSQHEPDETPIRIRWSQKSFSNRYVDHWALDSVVVYGI